MEALNAINDFTCEICEMTYSTNNSKVQHINTVHGEVKKFYCNVCTKKFGQRHQLVNHIENNHQSLSKDIKCKFCPKKFVNLGRLTTACSG